MIFLCCDTATPAESVAVVRDGVVLADRVAVRGKVHGPTLIDTLHETLAEAGLTPGQVDVVVCGLGPGSFTGLRIALATLKGMALALDRPLYGVRTVEAFRHAHPGERVVAVVDARRGEVFADAADSEVLEAPLSVKPELLAERLAGQGRLLLLGSGAELYADRLRAALPDAEIPADPQAHLPRAGLLARSVDVATPPPNLAALEPLYVRASDAELNYPDGFPDALMTPKQKLPPKRRPGATAG